MPPYTRPGIVSGVTKLTKPFFDNLLDGIDEKVSTSTANATYAPSFTAATAARRAPSTVFLGDSLTALGSTEASQSYGNSFPSLAAWMSNGQILLAGNAGVPSDTVQMIAARVQSQVIDRKPAQCFVLAGTNSTTKGYTHFNDARNVYETGIILPLLAAGIEPILATIPPRDFTRQSATATNTGPAVYQLTSAWNVFVRSMAMKYRLRLVDLYAAVVDPATGNYIDGYTDDAVHWSYIGANVVAKAVSDALQAPYSIPAMPLARDRYSLINMCASPLFLGGLGSGSGGLYPSGWNGSSSGLATSIVDPTVGDGLLAGKWLRLVKAAGATANANMIKTLSSFTTASGVPVAVGDLIGFGFRYRLTEANPAEDAYVSISLQLRGSGGSSDVKKTVTPLNQIKRGSSGVVWIETTMPANVVDVRFDVSFSANSSATLDLGQGTILDLTAMGVPSLTSVGATSPTATLVAPPDPTTPVPAQPAGLTAGTATGTTQPLSWTAASGATSYEVQYRIGEGAWSAGPTPSGASGTVTGLAESTKYTFRVRGVNATGYGQWSTAITATTATTTPPVVLTSDAFTRSDTTAGTLGTTDAANGGTAKAWSATSQIQILSNQVGAATLTTTRISTVDLGVSNARVRVKVAVAEGGLVARYTDASNYYSFRYDLATTQLKLEKRVAGTTTTLWSSASGAFTVGGTLSLSVQGSTITAYVNDVQVQQVTDSAVPAANLHGIRSAFNDTTFRLDDFIAYDY